MRFLVVLMFTFISAGCALKPEPAALLAMPEKPSLQKQRFVLEYYTDHAAPKVKSVQLPAHNVNRHQTVKIIADKTSVTDTLFTQITEALNTKQLKVTKGDEADYILSIHQLDLDFVNDTKYKLVTPKSADPLFKKVAAQHATQQCATIQAQVSMRLTHKASGDVVWFAKSAIDSASFHREPLLYSFEQQQAITNELEVATFIHQQNTEQARLARANKTISVPQYKTISRMTSLTKQQGPCSRTEVSALTPMMQYYLTSILIDKIKVQ
ncbi:hypothetical protein [Pseudoalteromonas mariniglutinosa]|uniref:hypothetical protein n=1 Tax=Pseudoalteromonas mariniglutinosa TaxID=206042 RepID=UPI0038501A93